MKKLYAVMALALLGSTSAFSQRLIDLQVTMTAPAASTTITSGTQFATAFVVRNVGTTTLKTSDSIAFVYSIDGSGLDFNGSGSPTVFFRTGKQMATNDTIMINQNLTLTFNSSVNGPHAFGMVVTVLNRSVDSARDNVTTNNMVANNVTFSGGTTTSVNDIQASIVTNQLLAVYPNPATDLLNAKINLGASGSVTFKLMDLMGRTVYFEDKGKMSKGEHTLQIPLKNMSTGYYFYQVMMGADVTTEKIYIK
ncbi:MAG TPA: T9SS type A sorting domain-containing protein [Flavipsychrobacter sp.]|nr:T9SS type A sorting domain-containing protein [Flavipsychrobacter sp.]